MVNFCDFVIASPLSLFFFPFRVKLFASHVHCAYTQPIYTVYPGYFSQYSFKAKVYLFSHDLSIFFSLSLRVYGLLFCFSRNGMITARHLGHSLAQPLLRVCVGCLKIYFIAFFYITKQKLIIIIVWSFLVGKNNFFLMEKLQG